MYWDRTQDAFGIPYEAERKCNVVIYLFLWEVSST